ncbi:MAG: hypothetical protein FJZ38_01670 [Candidatus Rokubacteria bacterium]|nr:hypothetical protein [Candidatus Rokubacteria bacterium]
MKKSASKKKPAKAAPKKSSRPVPKAKTAKPARQPAKSSPGTYTPRPIQGIGWAPFRYPLSS